MRCVFQALIYGQFERVLDRDVEVIPVVGAQVSLTYKVEEITAKGNKHRVTKTLDGTVDVVRYVYGLTAEDDYVIVTIYRD